MYMYIYNIRSTTTTKVRLHTIFLTFNIYAFVVFFCLAWNLICQNMRLQSVKLTFITLATPNSQQTNDCTLAWFQSTLIRVHMSTHGLALNMHMLVRTVDTSRIMVFLFRMTFDKKYLKNGVTNHRKVQFTHLTVTSWLSSTECFTQKAATLSILMVTNPFYLFYLTPACNRICC